MTMTIFLYWDSLFLFFTSSPKKTQITITLKQFLKVPIWVGKIHFNHSGVLEYFRIYYKSFPFDVFLGKVAIICTLQIGKRAVNHKPTVHTLNLTRYSVRSKESTLRCPNKCQHKHTHTTRQARQANSWQEERHIRK